VSLLDEDDEDERLEVVVLGLSFFEDKGGSMAVEVDVCQEGRIHESTAERQDR
jgi:hypothetical protein